MAKINLTQIVEASPDVVWQSWDDFGNIAKFHPALESSHLLGAKTTGEGAMRQCNLSDGKNHVQERIVEYIPNRKMVVDIFNGTMPLKRAVATISLKPLGSKTQVDMQMEFTPKFGVFGQLMVPMMKPQFRKMIGALLSQNAKHVEAMAA